MAGYLNNLWPTKTGWLSGILSQGRLSNIIRPTDGVRLIQPCAAQTVTRIRHLEFEPEIG
jgi:hypothetical protein